ncbi:RING-H2 finger protein ATL46-like [Carica papaya]|uniref:RING-H2 finger protein ATL46-like n=1 Tax=Carica papaya TaxID=3649 RepID=UPI000B8D1AF8|nr:RING-H2 finger protein ATL46-like [Carica papaya]
MLPKMHWIQSQIQHKHGLLTYSVFYSSPSYNTDYQNRPPHPHHPHHLSSGSKISPALLFIIVILAVIFFISGLLHLLVRFLIKHRSSSSVSESDRYQEMSGSDAFQRQLQQLFHLHDSGLDQAFIDALPVFPYKEIKGLEEPFDCAVCLCEFTEQDNLRLLPMCSHAFHMNCIDTWLLSNSTCPLCRGTLFSAGLPIENPVFDFEDSNEEDAVSGNGGNLVSAGKKPAENEIISEKRVFSVRLGKFRSTDGGGGGVADIAQRGEGETSSSNLDARRCYSMGSYQYVVADSDLQVALRTSRNGASTRIKLGKGRGLGQNGLLSIDGGDVEGKKINIRSKGESFSVSKIWQWSSKGKFPSRPESQLGSSSVTVVGWS